MEEELRLFIIRAWSEKEADLCKAVLRPKASIELRGMASVGRAGVNSEPVGTHQPRMKKSGWMDGWMVISGEETVSCWGPSSLTNHAGFLNCFLTT